MTSIEPHTFHSKGPALSTVLAASSTWERTLVPIEPGARVALASISGILALVAVGQHFVAQQVPVGKTPGFFLFGWPWAEALTLRITSLAPVYLLLTVSLIVLGALTQGFAMAGRRLQIVLGVLAAAGALTLLLPLALLMIAAANLVAWVALGALVIALGIGMLGVILAAAFDS